MSHEIRVPRLGWSMEEGTFVGWLKKPGETVRVGEPLFELEGEKATQAIEAVDAGVLHVGPDAPEPGAVVAVGTLLGYLVPAGQSAPIVPAAPSASETESKPAPSAASPAAPRRVTDAVASPRARRQAHELGVDWTVLRGSGRDGRIRATDVQAEAARRQQEPTSAPSRDSLPSRRRTIADRLRVSRERTVPVTLTTSFDATELAALRSRFKSSTTRIVPSYTDIVACVAAGVLTQHPHMAARRRGEFIDAHPATTGGIDIAIAVHTDDGVLAPVLRDVERKSLQEISEESDALIRRARAGILTAAEMQGSVFTITNLGAYRIEAFTPIINYPDIAILGLGAIRREAAVLPDGSIGPRDRMTLSLTFDHAVLDGVPAGAFLRDLAAALTTPAPLLAR